MKKLLRYLPLHFTISLIIGICIQYFYRIWPFGVFKSIAILLVFAVFTRLVTHKILQTFFIYVCFVVLGIVSVYLNNQTHHEQYYQKKVRADSLARICISKVLKESSSAYKYEARVIQIDSFLTSGKILVNLQKDSLKIRCKVDDQFYVPADFKIISAPSNPYQFDYKTYLARQGIHQQLFVTNSQWKPLEESSFSVLGFAATIRNNVQQSLQKYSFSTNSLGIINALLLGQRQELSKELLEDYANAGAIHILAVSGLHVGILLLLLNVLLKPLRNIPYGKPIQLLLTVFLLWSFAFIAGLSASVVRAVTMFSFVAFGQSLNRKTPIEFSLISSAFLLLVVHPLFLFDVGFQLSYLAVFGIVWGQPKLYSLWKPSNQFFEKGWTLITVSTAAQLGVLPLSLYYFHQFPGLFFVSNLLIIPILGVLLMTGILVIITAVYAILPEGLVIVYNACIELMNALVGWVASKEAFLFQEISMSFLGMLSSYLLIIAMFQVTFHFRYQKMVNALLVILLFQGVVLFEKIERNTTQEYLIFHEFNKSVHAIRRGKLLSVQTKPDTISLQSLNNLTNYKIGARLDLIQKEVSTNYFKIGNQDFLIVDEMGIYKLKGLTKPIVILQNSPKIHLERLIRTLAPSQIVAEGSNYRSIIESWKLTCKKLHIPFYATSKEGAFRYCF